MKKKSLSKAPLELIEEAFHLLRQCSYSLLLYYFLGTMPFVLAFLYFWTDMSKSPFAHQHITEAGLGLALVYLWMKTWQAAFASRLRQFIAGETFTSYTPSRFWRIFVQQTILQPYAIILLPIALLIYIPFPGIYAFYHNVSIYGDGSNADLKEVRKKAWSLANLWMVQNHALVALLFLVALVIYANIFVILLVAPALLKMLLDVETIFTLSGQHMLNTTFLAVVGGISYLFIGLLNKTVYILRAFYGESLKTGADLLADLKIAETV